jgi:hypothetical protein
MAVAHRDVADVNRLALFHLGFLGNSRSRRTSS